MKYNEKLFNNSVDYYQNALKGKIEGKLLFLICDYNNTKAFFSIAPLSKAVHELNGEMHVIVKTKEPKNFLVLKKTWEVYDEMVKGVKTKETIALKDFIETVNKRTKKDEFKKVFRKPELFLNSGVKGFEGNLSLEYKDDWYKAYKWPKLLETGRTLVKHGFDLKKNEKFGISFELIPRKKDQGLPLEDYLDSYSIARAMADASIEAGANVSLGSSTTKFSVLVECIRTSDLLSTLIGCELDKNVDEDVFKKFKVLSPLIGADKFEFNDASFGIHGKGYAGKLFFGEHIGYPTLNKKSRWLSPSQMMLKDRYETQTEFETRDPMMRYALTETLPIDIFIETCNVDYDEIMRRNKAIKELMDKCDTIRVVGKEIDGLKTDFTVYLVDKDKKIRREFISSDCDVTTKIDKEYYEKTGIKSGLYANFPSGEAFVTPEKVEGTIVGDVVINCDQSYRLDEKEPIVIECSNYQYRIVRGPKKIVDKIEHEKKEIIEKIKSMEESKALPQSMINMFRRCFNYIGEFAINLNPKAKVCDYLIVNEKIAKMLHVAIGSGFERDRKTLYHWDMVINSPRQKMDVYGIDSKGKEHWVIKKGEFVV